MPGSNGNSIMPSFDGAPSGGSSPITGVMPAGTYGGASVSSNSGPAPNGLIGFVSNLVNVMSTEHTNSVNRRWNERQNDLAWERQQQLIREQREYDSPSAQMERLMEAGLNPNLIYGQLSGGQPAATAPNAAGTFQGVAPQVDPSSMLIESQIQANRAKAGLDVSQSNRLDSLTPHEVDNLIKDTWLKDQSGQKILADVSNIQESTNYIKSQIAYVDSLNANERIKLANNVIDMIFRESYIDSEYEAYGAKLGMSINEYEYAVASLSLRLMGLKYNNESLRAQARLSNADAASIEASLPYLDAIYRANKRNAVISAGISAQNFFKGGKDLNWYTADKIFEYGTGVMQGVGSVVKPFSINLGGSQPIGFLRR